MVEIKSRSSVVHFEVPYNVNDLEETRGFAKRFPLVKDRVLSILKNNEYARRKDWYLTLLYWVKCGYIKLIIPQDKLLTITSPETITRARRKLTEEARKGDKSKAFLLKDIETINMRKERESEIGEYFSINKSLSNGGVK